MNFDTILLGDFEAFADQSLVRVTYCCLDISAKYSVCRTEKQFRWQ